MRSLAAVFTAKEERWRYSVVSEIIYVVNSSDFLGKSVRHYSFILRLSWGAPDNTSPTAIRRSVCPLFRLKTTSFLNKLRPVVCGLFRPGVPIKQKANTHWRFQASVAFRTTIVRIPPNTKQTEFSFQQLFLKMRRDWTFILVHKAYTQLCFKAQRNQHTWMKCIYLVKMQQRSNTLPTRAVKMCRENAGNALSELKSVDNLCTIKRKSIDRPQFTDTIWLVLLVLISRT